MPPPSPPAPPPTNPKKNKLKLWGRCSNVYTYASTSFDERLEVRRVLDDGSSRSQGLSRSLHHQRRQPRAVVIAVGELLSLLLQLLLLLLSGMMN